MLVLNIGGRGFLAQICLWQFVLVCRASGSSAMPKRRGRVKGRPGHKGLPMDWVHPFQGTYGPMPQWVRNMRPPADDDDESLDDDDCGSMESSSSSRDSKKPRSSKGTLGNLNSIKHLKLSLVHSNSLLVYTFFGVHPNNPKENLQGQEALEEV